MEISFILMRDRVPHLVKALGEGRVTVEEYDHESDRVTFKLESSMDVLSVFHAGIEAGNATWKRVLQTT